MSSLTFRPVPLAQVRLLPGLFQSRFDLNASYLLSLQNENLLQNHYIEAGLRQHIFEAVAKRTGSAAPGYAPR